VRTRHLIEDLEKIIRSFTRLVDGVGVFSLTCMMVVTTVDVLLRFFLNLPILGSIEITSFLLLLTILLGIPYAESRKQHVTINILVSNVPDGVRLPLETITYWLGMGFFSIVTWQSYEYFVRMRKLQASTAVLHLPVWPFVLVMVFAFALVSIVFLFHLLSSLERSGANARQRAAWFIGGIAVLFSLYAAVVWSSHLPWRNSPLAIGSIGLVILFLVFLSGFPVFSSLMIIGFLGMSSLRGTDAALNVLGSSPYTVVTKYHFSVIPLFVLMGQFAFFSGLGKILYDTAYKWIGHLPGGLAMGTVAACGGFAAMCGDSMPTAVAMGTVALPEMRKYNYDPGLASGCIAAGGTLGVLIPPSMAFILYALLTDESIATLFLAGVFPGILLVSLFMLSIYLRARRKPSLAPPGPRTDLREKIISLKSVWATLLLFAFVIGGMYAGVFTPTEGGGMGAFGALVIGLARKRLGWRGILASLLEAGRISAICVSILVGAKIFGYFLAASKLPMQLAVFVSGLSLSPVLVLVAILLIYLFLGCLMPAIPLLILTVPIFFPVVTALGYNPIWYGVIMVLMFEMAQITPPMGINILAIQTVASDISFEVTARGAIPYLLAMMAGVAILIVFPQVSLFLPNLLEKGLDGTGLF
jgi:tripartite ATP-independent transporter DctM subunit